MLGTNILWAWLRKLIFNPIMQLIYGLYFGIVKAIAWILDVLTQLFFIFAGMTPISNNTVNAETGKYDSIDIVNYFLTQKAFQRAYVYLCFVALGLIIVFTIAKIIKQDYFDRSGPRSKGPIFRNVALSFIAFICIIPVFYFLVDIAGSLALLFMKALGYKGGGIGSMLFDLSWDDGGTSIKKWAQTASNFEGLKASGRYDKDNFGWFSTDTFYSYYWDASQGAARESVAAEFYWWVFIPCGLILVTVLAKMMLGMISRMYKLIASFIIAPAAISQIVLDEGAKFKIWKDNVVKNALAVVTCVACFMLFMMISAAVPNIDLMRYAYTDQAASAFNLLESNSLTAELSYVTDFLYYGGDDPVLFDHVINAVGRAMILLAGAGAIQDMDSIIAPVLGSASAMDMGGAGKSISAAAGAIGKGALDGSRKLVGLAVGGVASGLTGLVTGSKIGRSIAESGDKSLSSTGLGGAADAAASAASSVANATSSAAGAATDAATDAAAKVGGGIAGAASEAAGAAADAAESATDAAKDATSAATDAATDATGGSTDGEETAANPTETTAGATDGEETAANPTETTAGATDGEETAANPTETTAGATDGEETAANPTETDAGAKGGADEAGAKDGEAAGNETPADNADAANNKSNTTATPTKAGENKGNSASKGKDTLAPLKTMDKKQKQLSRKGKIAKGIIGTLGGIAVGARTTALSFAGTAIKSGASIAGIAAKALLQATGMGAIAGAVEGTAKGIIGDTKAQFSKFAKKHLQPKKDANGNVIKDANGNPVYDSPVAKGLAMADAGIKAAAGWAGEGGGLTGLAFRGAAAVVDKVDSNDASMLHESSNSITSGTNDVNNVASQGGDVTTATQDVLANTDNLISEAANVNEISEDITGQQNPELQVGRSRAERENSLNVHQFVAGQNGKIDGMSAVVAAEREASSKGNKMPDGTKRKPSAEYTALVSELKKDGPGSTMDTFAFKRGLATRASELKQDLASGKIDKTTYDSEMRDVDGAYMHASGYKVEGNDAANAANASSYTKMKNYFASSSENKKKIPIIKHKSSDFERVLSEQGEIESKFEEGMIERAGGFESTQMDDLLDAKEDYATASAEYASAQTDYQNKCDIYNKRNQEYTAAEARYNDFSTRGAKTKQVEAARKDMEAKRTAMESARSDMDECTKKVELDEMGNVVGGGSLSVAQHKLAEAGTTLSSASKSVADTMTTTYAGASSQSKKNAKLNEGYAKFNTRVNNMRSGIERMRANGASAKQIRKAEDELEATVASGYAKYAERKKIKVTGVAKAKRNSNAAGDAETTTANKQAMGVSGAKKPQQKRATQVAQPEFEIDLDIVSEMENGNQIDAWFANACRTSLDTTVANAGDFSEAIYDIPSTANVGLSTQQLNDIIKDMDPAKAVAGMKTTGSPTMTEYKQNIADRYRAASIGYTECVDRAKRAMTDFNNTGGKDPDKLEEAKKAIAEALSHNINLRDIRIEIEKTKK